MIPVLVGLSPGKGSGLVQLSFDYRSDEHRIRWMTHCLSGHAGSAALHHAIYAVRSHFHLSTVGTLAVSHMC